MLLSWGWESSWVQLCWSGLMLLLGGPSCGTGSALTSLCVFQMPQVLVKLKKYPQGDKVSLEGHLWGLCVSQWCCGNAPCPKNLPWQSRRGQGEVGLCQ